MIQYSSNFQVDIASNFEEIGEKFFQQSDKLLEDLTKTKYTFHSFVVFVISSHPELLLAPDKQTDNLIHLKNSRPYKLYIMIIIKNTFKNS